MFEDTTPEGLVSLAELNHLRLEAMHLFEHCLTEGDEAALVSFIEHQVLYEPPRLQLLRDLADDLQQRLLSLREYHFDVRDRVVRTFSESYGVDITPLAPPDGLARYHHLTPDQMLAYVREQGVTLSDKDSKLLHKMVEASVQMAAQLHNDIQLTSRLHHLVLDWLEGMSVTVARRYWNGSMPDHKPPHNIRH